MNGSPGLQGDKMEAPSLSLADLPATALSAIHTALLVQDLTEGFCDQHKDAAALRSTCKTLRDAAVLPGTLKLSFPVSRTSLLPGLAALLSRGAAGTNLHLRLTEPQVDTAEEEGEAPSLGMTTVELQMWKAQQAEARCEFYDLDEEASWFDAVPNLKVLGDWLHSLELPCHHSISDLLCAICCDLPHLQHVTLHLCDDAFAKPDYDDMVPTGPPFNPGWIPRVCRDEARIRESQLCSITLSMPHDGKGPFQLSQGDLDLSTFPALGHLVLRGPIVKDAACEGANPLVLRPHVQVTIDPGLFGRQPTPHARKLTVYDGLDAMPEEAIPSTYDFDEEDAEAREMRKKLFVKKVIARALEMNGGRASEHYDFLQEFASRTLDDAAVEGYMHDAYLEWRSDLIFDEVDGLALKIVDEYEDFARTNF